MLSVEAFANNCKLRGSGTDFLVRRVDLDIRDKGSDWAEIDPERRDTLRLRLHESCATPTEGIKHRAIGDRVE